MKAVAEEPPTCLPSASAADQQEQTLEVVVSAQEDRQRIRDETALRRQAKRIQSCSLVVIEGGRVRLGRLPWSLGEMRSLPLGTADVIVVVPRG